MLVRFQTNLNFPDRFSKNTQIPNFMKVRPVGTKLFYADGQTDVTKLIVAICDFEDAPKNGTSGM